MTCLEEKQWDTISEDLEKGLLGIFIECSRHGSVFKAANKSFNSVAHSYYYRNKMWTIKPKLTLKGFQMSHFLLLRMQN